MERVSCTLLSKSISLAEHARGARAYDDFPLYVLKEECQNIDRSGGIPLVPLFHEDFLTRLMNWKENRRRCRKKLWLDHWVQSAATSLGEIWEVFDDYVSFRTDDGKRH